MFKDRVPVYRIDLEQDEELRWAEVIANDSRVVKRLAEEAEELVAEEGWYVPFLRRLAMPFVSLGYRLSEGRYMGEMRAWADALGVSTREVIMLNCSYEMSHLGGEPLGCTAGVRWVPGLGMVHLRNMDWPLENIGAATRVFEFDQDGRVFYAVGISGFVGVLSGMVPGGYSVTINWAPPVDRPRFDFGPAFLLREVLGECDTFVEAVYSLRHTPLSSPVFFTVCGVEEGQACVIERTRTDAVVRKFKAPVLAQGNHHVARKLYAHNYDEELLEDSSERVACMERELGRLKKGGLEELAACLDVEPVLNELSYQQMAFCPGTGEMKAWRWSP